MLVTVKGIVNAVKYALLITALPFICLTELGIWDNSKLVFGTETVIPFNTPDEIL